VDDKWAVQVGDLDHLYAPYQRCGGRDGRCDGPGLLVSADQGHTWHAGTPPTVASGWGMLAFRALGPQTLVITGTGNPTYLVSTDAGSTWRATEPAEQASAVPGGWRLLELAPVPAKNGPVTEYTVIAGDPVTGALAHLIGHLQLGPGQPARTMPESAGIWVAGSYGDVGPMATTAVSRDRGFTWTVRQLGPNGAQDIAILGYAQGTAYAALRPHDRTGPATLYRSTDNGDSWQKVTTDTPVPANANLLNGLVLDDGRILVPGALAQGPGEPTPTSGQRGLFVSADGGRTFQPTDQLPGAHLLYRVTGGYAATSPGTGIWLSSDGTTWTAVAQPHLR
jgi:photosystem II stability/assembly factor-like uncharacterized protein